MKRHNAPAGYYTPDEFAKIVNQHPKIIYRLLNAKKIKGFKQGEGSKTGDGRRWFIPKSEVENCTDIFGKFLARGERHGAFESLSIPPLPNAAPQLVEPVSASASIPGEDGRGEGDTLADPAPPIERPIAQPQEPDPLSTPIAAGTATYDEGLITFTSQLDGEKYRIGFGYLFGVPFAALFKGDTLATMIPRDALEQACEAGWSYWDSFKGRA